MKDRETEIASGILAGGKNIRMRGRNKAFIDIGGAPIIEKTIRLFEGMFDEIILVTNSPGDYKEYAERIIIIEDEIKGAGPLGGIHAALSKTTKRAVFFAACDMPFLHNGLIRRQMSCFNEIECDCMIPRIADSIEPLHGIYKRELKSDISNFLKTKGSRSIRDFLKTVYTFYLDLASSPPNRRIFRNLNTPDDLKRAEKLS